jgi:hypothetical protein
MSKLGRFRKQFQKNQSYVINKVRGITTGRLLCDTLISIQDLCAREKDYSLQNLSKKYLNKNYTEIEQTLECYQDP